ncbi:MAG: hypothetical protein OQK04_14890 [Kangiellaceae bacterium]|nr:hypothetical protein [Kangiellaceae bacterium]MCW8999994.1 hypothetical protein [Kangiellaceae bacterium]
MKNFWRVIGVLLLGWVAWDLYHGYTLLFNFVYRNEEPTLYWVTVGGWLVLALSCFYNPESWKSK